MADDPLKLKISADGQQAIGALAAVGKELAAVARSVDGLHRQLAVAGGPLGGLPVELEKARAQARSLFETLRRFDETAGLARVREGLVGIGTAARGAWGHVTRLITPLGALTAGASVGGLLELTKKAAEAGEHLREATVKTGI